MPYPAGVCDVLREGLGLDGRGEYLDVGCGPGSVTMMLAPSFERATGIDADADMVRVAEREARLAGITNVSWRCLRAEELPAGLGPSGSSPSHSLSTGSIGTGWRVLFAICSPATERSSTSARPRIRESKGVRHHANGSPNSSGAISAATGGPARARCRAVRRTARRRSFAGPASADHKSSKYRAA